MFSLVEVDCEMTENFKKVIEDIYLYGPGPLQRFGDWRQIFSLLMEMAIEWLVVDKPTKAERGESEEKGGKKTLFMVYRHYVSLFIYII